MRRAVLALVAVVGGGIAITVGWLSAGAGPNSTADALIGALTEDMIVLSVTIALVVEAALLYAVLRFRNSGNPSPSRDNYRFLTAWVVAIGLILLFLGLASLQTMVALDRGEPDPDEAVRVDVVAQQFLWTFEYRDENVTSQSELVLPENETVYLRLTSEDVIHSLHVPELGLKRDANPARWNDVAFTPTETGEYHLYCAEFCGQAHSQMRGTVRVVDEEEFEGWLDEQRDGSTTNGSRETSASPGFERRSDRGAIASTTGIGP